jgi:hypothetical protein
MGADDLIYPCWSEDFIERYYGGTLKVREWRDTPVISFCGRALESPRTKYQNLHFKLRNLKRALKSQLPVSDYLNTRAYALELLKNTPGVQVEAIVNQGFWGRTEMGQDVMTPEDEQAARLRYVENMVESDYVLCVRGAGNFSIRFYETIMTGRIPIFVDSDTVLPFSREIQWKDILVHVHEKDLRSLPDKLATFHSKFTNEEFKNTQHRLRAIWENWLGPEGFYKAMHARLQKVLNSI